MATKSSSIQIYRGESRRVTDEIAASRPLYFDAYWAELRVGCLRSGQEFVHLDVGDQYLIVNSSKAVSWAGGSVNCRNLEVLTEYPHELMDERAHSSATVVTAGGIEIFSGSDEDFQDFVLISFGTRRFWVLRDLRPPAPTYDEELKQLMVELEAELREGAAAISSQQTQH